MSIASHSRRWLCIHYLYILTGDAFEIFQENISSKNDEIDMVYR